MCRYCHIKCYSAIITIITISWDCTTITTYSQFTDIFFLLYLQFLCRLRLYYIHIYTYTPTHRYIHNTQIDTQIHTYIYNIYICIYCVSMLMKYIFWLYSKTLQPITLQTVKSILRWWLLLSTAAFLFNTPLPVTSSP